MSHSVKTESVPSTRCNLLRTVASGHSMCVFVCERVKSAKLIHTAYIDSIAIN